MEFTNSYDKAELKQKNERRKQVIDELKEEKETGG